MPSISFKRISAALILSLASLLALINPTHARAATSRQAPTVGRIFQAVRRVTTQRIHSYTVQPGDTLAKIAAKLLGSPNRWPDLWWWNRTQVKDPNVIRTGQELTIYRWRVPYASWEGYVTLQADDAIPKPAPVAVAAVIQQPTSNAADPAPAQSEPSYSQPLGGPWPGGAFGNCVVERESGGNPQVMNSSGHYGLYQFSFSTWVAYGGNPGDFGHASVGEQEQVFLNAMATPAGADNWAPYDGC